MVALTLKGIYDKGQLHLEQSVNFSEPVEVVVIFLKPDSIKKINPSRFSFRKSLTLTKGAKGKLSDLIVEERRSEKW